MSEIYLKSYSDLHYSLCSEVRIFPEDLAFHRDAYQSSTYGNLPASNAVSNDQSKSLTKTESVPWWQGNLGDTYMVTEVWVTICWLQGDLLLIMDCFKKVQLGLLLSLYCGDHI